MSSEPRRLMVRDAVSYRMLYRRIILQAFIDLDLILHPRQHQDNSLLEWPNAREWLSDPRCDDWLTEVCGAAGWCVRAVRRVAERMIDGNTQTIDAIRHLNSRYSTGKGE